MLTGPLYAELALTSQCNLRCSYCHFQGSPNETEHELDTDTWLRVLNELAEMKVFSVTLTGGEVLVRKDLPRLVEGIVRSQMRFAMLSNGVALEEYHAEMLRKSARCNYVQISLDGVGEVHDAARGEGSFARALRAIKLLQKYEVPVVARITLAKHNAAALSETVRYLLEEIKLDRVGCNAALEFSSSSGFASDKWLLSEEEFLSALLTVLALREKYPGRFLIRENVFSYSAAVWPYMIRGARGEEQILDRSQDRRCFPVLKKLFIRADGAVTPCNHLPSHVMGYVEKDRLAALWRDSAILRKLETPDESLDHICAECRECEYLPCCRKDGYCIDCRGYISSLCLKRYMRRVPDFDFENLIWRKNH